MHPLELTFGSDPELVLVDQKGIPVSALRILRTTKDHPIDLGNSVRIYADNVLVEAAFDPSRPEGIVDRMGDVLKRMGEALAPYDLLPQAATRYPVRELRHKTAWLTGCNDNYDAYTVTTNPKAKFIDEMRTGSFHIHIGRRDWETAEDDRLMVKESKCQAIKLLDLYVGLASVIFDRDPTAALRRKLYGKAGEHRPTKYGVEWRVLGNYALRTRSCVELVFDLVTLAMGRISDGTGQDALKLVPQYEIIRIINDNDAASAIDAIDCLGLGKDLLHRIMEQLELPQQDMKAGWGF